MKANRFGNSVGRSASTTSSQYAVRICLLGEAGAGKSTLFHRIKYNSFKEPSTDEPSTSIGTSRTTRSYDAHTMVVRPNKRTKINLTIVDTANRERYQSLTAQYYRGANVILMACSLDSEYTLTRLAKWHQEAQYYIDETEVTFAVVATKCDLPESEREVSQEMLQQFASHFAISQTYVFEVSSKTGQGVIPMLDALCEAVVRRFEGGLAGSMSTRNRSTERSSLLAHCSDSTSLNSEIFVEGKNGDCLMCCTGCRRNNKCVIL